jgi:hypothetical protein
MCDTERKVKGALLPARRLLDLIKSVGQANLEVSIFDPSGQDTIGGGCGQLHYVQEKLNKR